MGVTLDCRSASKQWAKLMGGAAYYRLSDKFILAKQINSISNGTAAFEKKLRENSFTNKGNKCYT